MDNSFFTLFFISNIIMSVIFGIIIFIKKLLKNHITVNIQYYINVIVLLILLAPFIPFQFIKVNSFFDWKSNISSLTNIDSLGNTTEAVAKNTNWLQDFSVSVEQSPYQIVNFVFLTVWILGIIIMFIATFYSNLRIGKIKKDVQVIQDKELCNLFDSCKEELSFHKKIVLGSSSLIKSPITFGVIRPYIVIPKDISTLSTDELKCVILHELCHCKRRDMLVNYFMCLCRIIYWFNPLVWYFLREMKIEMEVSCDYTVLKTLHEEAHIKYGEVILKFASHSPPTTSLLVVSEIGSSYKQIKRRIVTIANFQIETHLVKVKSTIALLIVLAVTLFSMPFISALAVSEDSYSLSSSNVIYKDYSNYFDDFSGGFVLYDSNSEQYTIYNEKESITRYVPASTYKIYSALFALESRVIAKDHSQMSWDGTQYPYEEWNKNQDLATAMKNSTNWYFQNLDQQIGREQLQNYYNQIHYGNQTLSSNINDYWLDSSLKISPVEQVEILEKFYNNEFSFEESNVQAVKDSLLLEESNGSLLSGKTGTVNVNGNDIEGWFVGYVEDDDNTYFFAVHIQGNEQTGGSAASKIALSILEKEGIYQSTH